MKYISLNNPDFKVDFREAVIMGQAPEKGLFFPEYIPTISKQILSHLKSFSRAELALEILKPFVGDSIEHTILKRVLEETLDFGFPLKRIDDSIFSLELFDGPTGAFKDVGARFLSRCLQYFSINSSSKLTVLVATSGDTGGAVADAFFGLENVEVVILFPSQRVSDLQRKQLTTYGKNIRSLEVEGTFDDCQALVKKAFADDDLKSKFQFTSANSINIARWISQQVYYFFALQQWPFEKAPVISVPSGNLGNLAAGMLAAAGGLPVSVFIAACNDNKAIVDYLETGIFEEHETVATISNAMDVGNPSNFQRVVQCLKRDSEKVLKGYSFSESETKTAIKEIYGSSGYILDPHGAVGYLGLKKYLDNHSGEAGIFLETAHPAKFENVVSPLVGDSIKIPDRFFEYLNKPSIAEKMPPEYSVFKELLLS